MSISDKPQIKSFWQRPEGVTGMIFLIGLLLGAGYLLFVGLPIIVAMTENVVYLSGLIMAFAALVYMVLDPKMRNLVGYIYKSVMRWITGLFVQIDPIGILKSYVEDLKKKLLNMNKQMNLLRGQMHKLKEMIVNNNREIKSNLNLASEAKATNNQSIMILKSRKAGRLQDSNLKFEDLYNKMEILYRVLNKMYQNGYVMVEDLDDQVAMKEQERKAILASNSAMKSAMSIINGDADKRIMFDMALEAIAEDVSHKVGEMERFMDVSDSFMKSIDLQNGVFEEEGLAMLEKWESESFSFLLGDEKKKIIDNSNLNDDTLDLNEPIVRPVKEENHTNQYDSFFDF